MSSAAAATAAVASTSVPPAAAAVPALATASPFLASQPLAMAYGVSLSPRSPIGSGDRGATPIGAPSGAAPPAGGLPAIHGGPPPPSSWSAPPQPYGTPPVQQPYGAPPPHHYYGAPPPLPYSAPAPPQPYSAPALPQPYPTSSLHPHGAAAASPHMVSVMANHGAPAAPYHSAPATHYGGPGAVSPGSYPPYSVYPVHPGAVSSMGLYASPHAHADSATVPAPFYFSHLLPVKLASDNYLSWRAQVLPLLRSRYLEGYVDGSIPCPPPHHPAYNTWVAQD